MELQALIQLAILLAFPLKVHAQEPSCQYQEYVCGYELASRGIHILASKQLISS